MKPEVKKYLNAFQFLQDCYQYRKTNDPQFSYDVWSRELGASDKSYVRFMTMGQRAINSEMTGVFADNLKLSEADKVYFSYLVQYSQSKTQEQKELFGKKLIQLLQMELEQNEISLHYEFLSNPILPRLQVLLSLSDICNETEKLAWILGCSESELNQSIDKLVQLGMIEKTDQGIRCLNKNFKIPDGYGDFGLEAFYMQNLEISKAAIQRPKEERKFKSLFLPLNKSEMDQFLANLQSFVREQLNLFNPDKYADRRLYQVHMNMVAISESLEEASFQRDEKSDLLSKF